MIVQSADNYGHKGCSVGNTGLNKNNYQNYQLGFDTPLLAPTELFAVLVRVVLLAAQYFGH